MAKHDHHCIWVRNCLGKANYAYFVGLMASLGTLLTYGAYLAFMLITVAIHTIDPPNAFDDRNKQTARQPWSEAFESWALGFAQNLRIGAVGMLAAFTAPLAWGLLFYHVYLVWAGMTTNETSKWADWRDDITDGIVYRAERLQVAEHDGTWDDTEIKPFVKWPISSSQQLLVSEGGPPGGRRAMTSSISLDPSSSSPRELTGAWRQIYSLADIDNLYDLGFWDNLMDVLVR